MCEFTGYDHEDPSKCEVFCVIFILMKESAESELVQKLAAMSPLIEDDTSTGLHTTLHTKWTQRTRYGG